MTKNRRGRPAAATRLSLPGSTFLTRGNYYPYMHKKRAEVKRTDYTFAVLLFKGSTQKKGGDEPRPYNS
jgi:hypothetical protein